MTSVPKISTNTAAHRTFLAPYLHTFAYVWLHDVRRHRTTSYDVVQCENGSLCSSIIYALSCRVADCQLFYTQRYDDDDDDLICYRTVQTYLTQYARIVAESLQTTKLSFPSSVINGLRHRVTRVLYVCHLLRSVCASLPFCRPSSVIPDRNLPLTARMKIFPQHPR